MALTKQLRRVENEAVERVCELARSASSPRVRLKATRTLLVLAGCIPDDEELEDADAK